MTDTEVPMLITLFKTAKDGKIHYYTVHDRQQVLDAPYAICASWRVGLGRERERLHRFDRMSDRDAAIRKLIAKRIKDGYKVLYTFSRAGVSAFGQVPGIPPAGDEGPSTLPPVKAGGL